MRIVAEGLEFPEGPVVLDDGTVLVVELKGGTIAAVDPATGAVERVAETGGSPNGAALGPDGRLYVCNSGGAEWTESSDRLTLPTGARLDVPGTIQAVDLATGEVTDLYDACGEHQLNGPNDIVFDAEGGFYFTDHGKHRGRAVDSGVVYYARIDGSEIVEVAFPMISPNGIGLSPSGAYLYVAETITSRVWRYTVEAPGKVTEGSGFFATPAGLLYAAPEFRLYDSLAVEAGGNVCVATLGEGAITVISPEGELVDVVAISEDDPFVTNIAFGGPDLGTAYITASASGRLYEAAWPRPGLRIHHGWAGERI